MNCSVCQRDTSPVTIGGQVYCQVCGNPYPTGTKPRSMDLSPRRAITGPAPSPKPAAALHTRVKSPHVVDLRHQKPLDIAKEVPATTIAQHEHHTPAAAPASTVHERHIARFTDRFEEAKKYGRSAQISRFEAKTHDQFGHPTLQALTASKAEPAAPAAAHQMPHLAASQHEAMTRLPAAPAPMPKTSAQPAWRPHLSLSPHTNRTLATAAAIVIMAGYVWVQNYPKMALQAASSRAGLSASLPGFIPSSYSLAHTTTAPGLVTLSYGSPSAPEPLKIAQSRTTWDSSSLLDNFVVKHADDYAAVQGEGLTIYLYNNNQATWVNHGVWYNIEGAALLSREQVLKIAYSL